MSHVQCAMDDGGQRLLDVIEDTHVLETFLRENFSNSGLEDSPRFDNVSSSTDSGLVSSGGLDSFIFDGQLVDPLRGGPNHHPSIHPHQVTPHVLQQVLHPPSLSTNPSLSGGHPHQLHPHQLHHHHHHQQHHHLQQSALLQHHSQQQQHHQQQQQQQVQQQQQQQQQLQQHQQQQHQQLLLHQTSLPALHSPVGSSLDVDCIGRNRDACGGTRNDSDHTLQQLLASAPTLGGSSQPLLQLHHQPHQPSIQQSHPLLQQPVSQTQQLHPSQSPHSIHQQPSVLSSPGLTSQLPSQNVLVHHHHQTQRQPTPRPQPTPSKVLHQQQTHVPLAPTPNSDLSSNILPLGAPTPVNSLGGTCSRLSNLQLPPQPHNVSSQEIPITVPTSKTQLPPPPIPISPTKASVAAISTQSIVQAGANSMSSKVQVVGGHSRVISSGPQLLTSSQILPGAQIVQPSATTQMISGGSIFTGSQVLSAQSVLPGGQVLTGMQNGQVFQGGQLIQGAQVIANSLLNNSNVITTVGGLGSNGTSFYVTPTLTSQLQNHAGFASPLQNKIISSSPNTGTTLSISTTGSLMLHTTSSSGVTTTSTFTIPSRSPASSLTRASPGLSYPATPSPLHTATSPASFPCRSPAPSPQMHMTTMRSPASPAVVVSSQPVTSVVNSVSNHSGHIVSGVVGNVMQGLVNHLPLTQIGSNGVVFTGGNAVQMGTGIKQVVQGGQLIQLVSSPQANQHRHAVALPKPIQPKPQLLPKPSPQGTIRQPPTPPPGKSIIGTRQAPQNTQHQIVLGSATGQQPTVISQQNLGGFVLNSSLLQAGLQQPLLIPQPNGVQLLVRPAGHNTGAGAGQTLIMPMPGQSHVVTSVGKIPQPQTLVIPANGQTPALVIPQGLGSSLGGGSVLSSAQGGRAPQPIIRFVAPQAPLQLQQINTPNGPMLVAVPIGQTLNLPGMFAQNTVRTLAPQVAQGTLQLTASSLAPASGVNINHIQIPGGNSSNHPIHLTPSTLSSVISTTNATKTPHEIPSSTTSTARVMLSSSQTQNVDVHKNYKKKSKKKKKEKDSKDDRNKGKGVSINLNELLKESGIVSEMIFDENDFGGLGFEEPPTSVPAATQSLTCVSSPLASPIKASPISTQAFVSTGAHISLPVSTTTFTQTQMAIPSIVTSVNNSTIPSLPTTSMCFTLDAEGKLILGSSVDATKPQITAIAGSFPQAIQSSPLQGLCSSGFNLSSGGSIVFESSDGTIHGLSSPKNNQGSLGHIVALHPHNSDNNLIPSTLMKIDNIQQSHLQSGSKSIQNKILHVGNEMIKVAQNTQLLQSQSEKGTSIISSLLNNPIPPLIGISNSNMDSFSFSEKVNLHNVVGDLKSNIPLTLSSQVPSSQPSQISINNPTVIVSSNLNNSFLSGAILNGKSIIQTSQSSDYIYPSNSLPQQILTNSISSNFPKAAKVNNPVSMPVIDNINKVNSYQNQYIASVKNHNIIDNKINKRPSRRKKKKDQEIQSLPAISTSVQTLHDRIKSSGAIHTGRQVQGNPIVIHNGNISSSLTGSTFQPIKTEVTIKTETPIMLSPSNSNSMPLVMSSPNHNSVATDITPTPATTLSSYNISPAITSIASSKPNITFTSSSNSSSQTNSGGGFVFTGQHVVLQSGQQLKQLLLSPQNQEALKRLHNQIQDIQNRKGTNGEQDKLLHQKLIADYKRIMATGTPVPVCPSALPQVQQNINSSNQHNAIKYSHSVGHKKIFLTPNQKKTPCQHLKKSFVELSKTSENKLRESEPTVAREISSTTSVPPSCVVTGFTTASPTVTLASPTPLSSASLHHRHISPGRTNHSIKPTEPEIIPCSNINVATSFSSDAFRSQNDSPNSSLNSMSMPMLIPSPKATSLALTVSPNYQKVSIPQSSPITGNISVSTQSVPCSTQMSLQLPSPSNVMQPQSQLASPIQTVSHQMHSTHSPNNSTSVQSGFTIPLTREQLFELQLRTDQNGALAPDYNTPFKNKTDACKRLIRYHVFNDLGPSPKEMTDNDAQFEIQSETLIRKFNSMKHKYQNLLLKDSMRRHSSSETAMLYRLFVSEEKQNIESERQNLQSGKDLNLPPAPAHWLAGVVPPPYYPFSWEENWPDEKVYTLNSCPPSPQTFSDEEGHMQSPLTHGEEALDGRWEDDLDEEGPDEPRLQILECDETDESQSKIEHSLEGSRPNSASGVETILTMKGSYSSKEYLNCDSAGVSSSSLNCNEHLDERTIKRYSSDNSSIRTKYNKHESDDSLKYTHKQDRRSLSLNNSTKENGFDRINTGKESPSDPYSLASFERNYFHNSSELRDNNSDSSYPIEKGSERSSKYNKKLRTTDKEKRRHERNRDKSRSKDERRQWKMKLKYEDKPSIPPLLIRSDERPGGAVAGGGGGLKLTLKKQVGSGDYYRVGSEDHVALSDHDEEGDTDDKDASTESNQQLRNLSVVLEDCLHRSKREPEEIKSVSKKNKRLKTQHNDFPLCNEFNIRLDRKNAPAAWPSPYTDDWVRQGKHNSIQRSGYLIQSQQYMLDSSDIPTSQAHCVPSQGPKIIHQPPRNSHRLS